MVEVVGGAHLNRALRAVRIGGGIAFVGLLEGLSAPIDTWMFVAKNVRLHGIETGSRAMLEALIAFLTEHGVRPVVDRSFPFEAFPEALRYLESGAHVGKVVVTLDGAETPV